MTHHGAAADNNEAIKVVAGAADWLGPTRPRARTYGFASFLFEWTSYKIKGIASKDERKRSTILPSALRHFGDLLGQYINTGLLQVDAEVEDFLGETRCAEGGYHYCVLTRMTSSTLPEALTSEKSLPTSTFISSSESLDREVGSRRVNSIPKIKVIFFRAL